MTGPSQIPTPLDKDALIGACTRLRLDIDAGRLVDEVAALPAVLWGSRGGRVGVHMPTEAIFLRGFAPAEGPKPIGDREILQRLPYVRHIIESIIPAPPQRCLLAKLKPGGVITAHRDRGPYFAATIRIHVPVLTSPCIVMHCRGLDYTMTAGEAWALNNSNVHAVVSDWDQPRTHLICDFLATPALEHLLLQGERELGRANPDTVRRVAPPRPGPATGLPDA